LLICCGFAENLCFHQRDSHTSQVWLFGGGSADDCC
jgi:hypothetical protein